MSGADNNATISKTNTIFVVFSSFAFQFLRVCERWKTSSITAGGG